MSEAPFNPADHIQHLPEGSLLTPALIAELVGIVELVEAELADRSRRVSGRLAAIAAALAPGRRVHAKSRDCNPVQPIRFEQEYDSHTAATLMDLKEDTLRSQLRAGLIAGRKVNGRWMVPASMITSKAA
jgi:hypothetical protein